MLNFNFTSFQVSEIDPLQNGSMSFGGVVSSIPARDHFEGGFSKKRQQVWQMKLDTAVNSSLMSLNTNLESPISFRYPRTRYQKCTLSTTVKIMCSNSVRSVFEGDFFLKHKRVRDMKLGTRVSSCLMCLNKYLQFANFFM